MQNDDDDSVVQLHRTHAVVRRQQAPQNSSLQATASSRIATHDNADQHPLAPAAVAAAASQNAFSMSRSQRVRQLVNELTQLTRENHAMTKAETIIQHELLRDLFAELQFRWLFKFHLVLIIGLLLGSVFLYHEIPALVKLSVTLPSIVIALLTVFLLGVRNWMLPVLRSLAACSAFISLTLLVHRIMLISLSRTHPALWADIGLLLLQCLDALVAVLYWHSADQIAIARGHVSLSVVKLELQGLVHNPVAVRRKTPLRNNSARPPPPPPIGRQQPAAAALRHSLWARFKFWFWSLCDPHTIMLERQRKRSSGGGVVLQQSKTE
jgi:hypothetical protein